MENTKIYTKWWFWVLMFLGGGIFLLIFKMISKSLSNPQAQPKEYTYTDPVTGQTKSVTFAPEPYTDALHEEIYAIFSARNMKPFEDLLALEDGEFVAVATDWNARYKKEDSETLLQAIRGEWFDNVGKPKEVSQALFAKFLRLNII